MAIKIIIGGLALAYGIEWLQYLITPGYPKPPPFKGFRAERTDENMCQCGDAHAYHTNDGPCRRCFCEGYEPKDEK